MADLLKDPTPGDDGDGEPGGSEGEGGGSRSKPKKFNDLAETLGIEADELYGLEVVSGADGKPVSVQQLKDMWAKRSEFSVAQLTWEEERTRQQTDLVRGNAELRELLAAIPRDKLDQKVLDAVKAKITESSNRERARTLEVIPDWKNEATRTKELAEMGDWLKGYGFQAGYLTTVFDHRAILMMRDAWRREVRVRAALEEVEREGPKPMGKGKPQGGKAPSKAPSGAPARGRAGLESLLSRE